MEKSERPFFSSLFEMSQKRRHCAIVKKKVFQREVFKDFHILKDVVEVRLDGYKRISDEKAIAHQNVLDHKDAKVEVIPLPTSVKTERLKNLWREPTSAKEPPLPLPPPPPVEPLPPTKIEDPAPPRPSFSRVVEPAPKVSLPPPAQPLPPMNFNTRALDEIESLPTYCLSLIDDNFHKSTTDALIKNIQALDKNPNHDIKVVMVHGPCGSGKTFAVQKACLEAEFENVSIDMSVATPKKPGKKKNQESTKPVEKLDGDVLIRGAILGAPDVLRARAQGKPKRRIRVVIVDALDEYDKLSIDKFFTFLTGIHGLTGAKVKTPHKKAARFAPNFVILVVTNPFHKNISRWWYKFGGPKQPNSELKITPPNYQQACTLVNRCVVKLGARPNKLYNDMVVESLPNVTALLMKLQFSIYGLDKVEGGIDDRVVVNFFGDCKTLLSPPDDLVYEKYDAIWEREHTKIDTTIFNSYPQYVRFIPPLRDEDKVRKHDMDLGVYSAGIDSMAEISDAFSMLDTVDQTVFTNDENQTFTQILRRTVRNELQDVAFPAVHNAQIFPKYQNGSAVRPPISVSKQDAEKFHMIHSIHQIEEAKRGRNMKFQLSNDYQLANHVGTYVTRADDTKWLQVDMFPSNIVDENGVKLSKKNWETTLDPKLKTISVFSHDYYPQKKEKEKKKESNVSRHKKK